MVPIRLAIETSRGPTYAQVGQFTEIIEQVETFDSRRKWLRRRFVERGDRNNRSSILATCIFKKNMKNFFFRKVFSDFSESF